MKSRKYDKRIDVWEVGPVPDGFGGSTVEPLKITSSWANLITEGLGRKAYNLGLQEFNNPLLFEVRGRNDVPYNGRNLYLIYRGEKYIIQAVKNEDLRDIDTQIFCTKEETLTVPYIGVISNG